MKIRHLYIKILFPFVVMLMVYWAISQTALENSFSFLWGENHSRETRLTALALKTGSQGSKDSLAELIARVGAASGSEIIVTDSMGKEVAMTPDVHKGRKHHMMKGSTEHGSSQMRPDPLMSVVLSDGKKGFVYILKGDAKHEQTKDYAFLWLLAGAGILAVLAVPVTRQITSPLKKLHKSVRSLADGDFSHRAQVQGHDEIADLAEAFNNMAGKIERVLSGSKELTANVSHELRSPLARMRILYEMISNDLPESSSSSLKENVGDLDKEIQSMDRLIDRILQFSKLDMSILEAPKQELDFAGILADSLERHSRLLKDRGLKLEVEGPDDMAFSGDYESLVWMFDNIIGNAAKFSPKQGLFKIHLSEYGGEVHFEASNSVQDSEVDVDSLFEPFRRGEKISVPGSGLGLAIVKRISEQHSGKVEAFYKDDMFVVHVVLPVKI